jgi:hypothetical protein
MAVGNSISVVGRSILSWMSILSPVSDSLLKKGVVCFSETVITTYQITPCPKVDHFMTLHH